jgi:peptide/nickel transport system permease protein
MSDVAAAPDVAIAPAAAKARSPWLLAFNRLRRNRSAMLSLAVFVLLCAACVCAPVYAHDISKTDPFQSNVSGTILIDGKQTTVIQPNSLGFGSTPIGPTWSRQYFIGADDQGRDVMARTLYGGRISLEIGIVSALISCALAAVLGLVAGFFGGLVDGVIARILDIVWAFPVYLFAISLSTVLLLQGLELGPFHVDAGSIWLPTLIIAIVYVPYVARPIRGETISLRNREFMEAASSLGASNTRLLFSELLPNVMPVVIVLFPLMIATNILTESALSYLSIGVQPPQASLGTIVSDGQSLLYTRPWVSILPGLMIVVAVLTLNVLGDGVRDALDPRGRVRSVRRISGK